MLQVRGTYLKNALLSSASEDVFTDSLAQSVGELWPVITSAGLLRLSKRSNTEMHVAAQNIAPVVKLG